VALGLGAAIGLEREYHGHPAGVRTLAMVSIGSCIFTELGVALAGPRVDTTRIAAQVVTGIGFLGAGAILREGGGIKGLTTAATVWVVAAIGMAAGFRLFILAALGSFLVVAALTLLRPLGELVSKRGASENDHPV
jgi:putative Mg2+ transporter-C (MgtC) family protein